MFTVVAYLVAAALLIPPAAKADELDTLNSQILKHPSDAALNLRFAELAEASGHLRWALATYERMLIADPNNEAALKGLARVQNALKPDTMLLTLQYGTQYESNPSYYLRPRTPELEAFGSASLVDERNLSGMRWRTNVVAAGLLHAREDDLTYAAAGFDTGPVLDAMPGWTFRPAIGGGASYFDHHFYYSEGAIGGTFESKMYGIYRSLLLRTAYRQYDQMFPSDNGFYYEARGRIAIPNALGPDNTVVLSPWVLSSNISGSASVVTPIVTDLQPGAYLEYGGRVDLLHSISNWAVFGVNVAGIQRNYRNDLVTTTLDKRRDVILIPGAQLIFPNLFAYATDLRIDYQFINDRSNDQTKSFTDHVISASVVTRFDPRTGPAWVQPQP